MLFRSEEYVAPRQPVGSKTLVERASLHRSPSTVRAELSDLERLGLLTHPHTSAGRVPTEAGYRVYVDELLARKQADPGEFSLGLASARAEVEEALQATTEALSQVTRLLALVSAPPLETATVRHVEVSEQGRARLAQDFGVQCVSPETALADAEVVLEGYVNPRDRRFETKESEDSGIQGRHHFHPEWAGYMGKAYKAPTFHVTAVTTRKPSSKPIIFALAVHTLDEHNIDTTIREATIFELCNRLQPGIVQDVVIPYCMTDWGGCIIQVKKRNPIDEGWQRNFLGAALSCSQGMRIAIAVSEDTDPYSMDDVMWCLTTRVNPQTDILNPIPGGRGQTFMPAERMTAGNAQWTASNTRFEGGMGIDATVPYGYEEEIGRAHV